MERCWNTISFAGGLLAGAFLLTACPGGCRGVGESDAAESRRVEATGPATGGGKRKLAKVAGIAAKAPKGSQHKVKGDHNNAAKKDRKQVAKKEPRKPRVPGVNAFRSVGKPVSFEGAKWPQAVDVDNSGRVLVADKNGNRVLVFSADGKLERKIPVAAPVDADFLRSADSSATGGFLVVSAKEKAVIELDPEGRVVWAYRKVKKPLDADRLANGNTMIADGGAGAGVLEVDRGGNVVWSHRKGFRMPKDVEVSSDGTILVADYNSHCVRCIRRDGSTCWRVNHIGHPSQLRLLDDGTFLVATHKAGSLVWVGKERDILGHWKLGPDLEDFAFTRDGIVLAQMRRPEVRISDQMRRNRVRWALGEFAAGEPAKAPVVVGTRELPGVETRSKNLVLILVDSLRRDHVPWHGYWRETAPRLAQLADKGLIFDSYYTQAPWTKPSVASLLTSTYPSVHGAAGQLPTSQLPASLTTLAEALSAGGYYTAAVMENPHMGDRRSTKGFEQGYQRYDYLGGKKFDKENPALITTTAISALKSAPADKPFFLTMFYMNPHYPYAPKRFTFGKKDAGPSNSGPINGYDAEMREVDREIGRLLDYLASSGQADNTVVVFSSDHGEEFGDHGKNFHGDTLYDCVLAVPLVIAGLDRVGRFPGLAREIDLLPTLLDYLDVPLGTDLEKQISGVSLKPFLDRAAAKTGLIAYSQTRFRDNVHMLSERSEERKVIVDFKRKEVQIYDLDKDPQEYNNLASVGAAAAEIERLGRWEAALAQSAPKLASDAEGGGNEVIPEEVLERLRAAGYLQDHAGK